MIPEYITPGAFVRLLDGSKALIYATTGGDGFPIHGAIYTRSGWEVDAWTESGAYYSDEPEYDKNIVGPWVDKPDCSKLWSMLPPWIHWLVVDLDGAWYCFTDKPRVLANFWHNTGPKILIPPEYAPSFTGDWKDSLCERPQP